MTASLHCHPLELNGKARKFDCSTITPVEYHLLKRLPRKSAEAVDFNGSDDKEQVVHFAVLQGTLRPSSILFTSFLRYQEQTKLYLFSDTAAGLWGWPAEVLASPPLVERLWSVREANAQL